MTDEDYISLREKIQRLKNIADRNSRAVEKVREYYKIKLSTLPKDSRELIDLRKLAENLARVMSGERV